jgi:hypothetical protein
VADLLVRHPADFAAERKYALDVVLVRVVLYVTDGVYAWHLAKNGGTGTRARQLAGSTTHRNTTPPSSDRTGES